MYCMKIFINTQRKATNTTTTAAPTCTETCNQCCNGPACGGPSSSTAAAHARAAPALRSGDTKSSYSLNFHRMLAASTGASSLSDLFCLFFEERSREDGRVVRVFASPRYCSTYDNCKWDSGWLIAFVYYRVWEFLQYACRCRFFFFVSSHFSPGCFIFYIFSTLEYSSQIRGHKLGSLHPPPPPPLPTYTPESGIRLTFVSSVGSSPHFVSSTFVEFDYFCQAGRAFHKDGVVRLLRQNPPPPPWV